jgi:heptosyltransferase III
VALGSFPPSGSRLRVPAHQSRQLDRLGVPRLRKPWLGRWRAAVLPRREGSEILLHAGSGDPKKNVPPAAWLEALRRLRAHSSLPVRLLLGPAEEERGGFEALFSSVETVERCTSLEGLLAALARAALYLGNDSGPTHLSALLGVPTVAAFGPSDAAVWRPLGPRVLTLTSERSCAPCSEGGPIPCELPECVLGYSGEEIAGAALALSGLG